MEKRTLLLTPTEDMDIMIESQSKESREAEPLSKKMSQTKANHAKLINFLQDQSDKPSTYELQK